MASKPTNTSDPRKAPLTCRIHHGKLVISVGIETIAFCAENGERFQEYNDVAGKYFPIHRVANDVQLAFDVRNELLREEEDGTTPLHILLDDAIEKAYENGSLGFSE